MTPGRQLQTPGEVALGLNIPTKLVLAAIRAGELQALRFNRKVILVRPADVEEWLAGLETRTNRLNRRETA